MYPHTHTHTHTEFDIGHIASIVLGTIHRKSHTHTNTHTHTHIYISLSAVLPFHMGEIKLIKFYCKHFAKGVGKFLGGGEIAPLRLDPYPLS